MKSDSKSWIYFRSHVASWEVIWSLHITYLTASLIYLLRNSSLGNHVPDLEDITRKCTAGVSGWTEGRPPSSFESLGHGTGYQHLLSKPHLQTPAVRECKHVEWRVARRYIVFNHPFSSINDPLMVLSAINAFQLTKVELDLINVVLTWKNPF